MWKCICMAVALWGCTGVLQAKVVLPSVFTDNMVLQQKTDITFYGDATKNKQLIVKTGWNGKEYHTEADGQGKWSLKIPTPAAGGPYEITFSDGKKLQLKNVMIGEVWFCSGQSNMEMPVAGWGKVMNYEQEIAEAAYPAIRLFQVKKNTSLAPLKEVESTLGGWQECSSATVPEFSALAYFYARALWKELNVPIGVIDCTWGGTPAEAWTNHETLRQVMGFREEMDKLERLGFDPNRMEQAYSEERAHWQSLFTEKDKGMENGKLCWTAPSLSEEDWQTISLPGYWEGKGLKDFDGIIWFRRSLEIPAEWGGKTAYAATGDD